MPFWVLQKNSMDGKPESGSFPKSGLGQIPVSCLYLPKTFINSAMRQAYRQPNENNVYRRMHNLFSDSNSGTVVERRSLTGELSLSHPCSTYSWWVTTYVGKPSAIGQPTRPTQPFILSGSINWVVTKFIGCVLHVCWSRHLVSDHETEPVRLSIATRRVWLHFGWPA